eukprot:CAMPEP_0174243804 /NCGR_PEP_ID=MMETSP0417-20130205/32892_1 /TAXON_ID=242541 /ORGANISM="Mayorella sp, Strain BSH-02190019" /LENGTH=751 /DNA_ID=CAMNT_0015323385 /DNA_START=1 /DNA_END=2252 /DNA_ORIENTATION=+
MESMHIAESTKSRYKTAQTIFLRYVKLPSTRAQHPEWYSEDGEFQLSQFTTAGFKNYLSMRAAGTLPQPQLGPRSRQLGAVLEKSLGNDKSALLHLFKQRGVMVPAGFDEEISVWMRGFRRDVSNRRQSGDLKAEPGKRELSFDVYCWLARRLLETGDVFAWCYCVMTWNLLCRSDTTSHVAFSHLSWHGDALRVAVPKSKTNQAGESPAVAKHVYANSLEPAICPILALGVYSACTTFTESPLLYPGSHQSQRFSVALKKAFLSSAEGMAALQSAGLSSEDVGVHSLRKGGSSYALSGLAGGGPSVVSVLLRGEWSLSNVHRRYFKHQDAADQFIGRILAGLPLCDARFADLPPRFEVSLSQVGMHVREGVTTTFSSLLHHHPTMHAVLRHCLASVLYHRGFLEQHLGVAGHRVGGRAGRPGLDLLLSRPALSSSSLRALVASGGSCSVTGMRASGLPPHVIILRRQSELSDLITEGQAGIREELRNGQPHLANSLCDRLLAELRSAGIGGSYVTADGLGEVLGRVRREIQESVLAAMSSPSTAPEPASSSASASSAAPSPSPSSSSSSSSASASDRQLYQLYRWPTDTTQEPTHRLPYGTRLPCRTLLDAMSIWYLGDARLPPISSLKYGDLTSSGERAHLTAWRTVFREVERILQEYARDQWSRFRSGNATDTAEHRALLVQLYHDVIRPRFQEVSEDTCSSTSASVVVGYEPYQIRSAQRKISTIAKELRKRKRRSLIATTCQAHTP